MQGLLLFGESAGDEENEFLRLQVGVRVLPVITPLFIVCLFVCG
jgi:hypothetical protein